MEHISVRFDLSHVLTDEPEIDGTYYIDCKVHPAHVPLPGDRIWLDENDQCTAVKDKHLRKEVLKALWNAADHDAQSPAFVVDYRIMNYCKFIGFNICCILKKL